jgi:hypothetical protein
LHRRGPQSRAAIRKAASEGKIPPAADFDRDLRRASAGTRASSFFFPEERPPSPQQSPVAENDDAKVAQASIRDGEGGPQYRPSPDFLARDVAQVVAFLIRNRGRLDTETVRAKWVFLDRASLPLAIFLREIEANGTWDELKNEIKTTPATGLRGPRTEMPKSLWHRKILAILPDWTKRGDDLLRGAGTEGPSLETAPDKGRGRAGHRTADAVRQASALTYSPRRHPHRAE